jgi:aryl-alcohol dehydrogenase-like predicted oxidoreductase
MSKLVLGTVQFGLKYGINNQSGIPGDFELKEIFLKANQCGIDILDTAQGYGDAEERIGVLSGNLFKVISKFKYSESTLSFREELLKSLRKSRTEKLYGYMAHDADLLIENPFWWKELQIAKEQGLVEKIGYSLYSVKQLESLLTKQMFPDIIQVPYNILDRRFESFLPELASMEVEIHTRSVYLQGLLQMNPYKIPSQLVSLKPYLIRIREIAKNELLSLSELCLGFVVNNPYVNKVVIGIDNLTQLADNIHIYESVNLMQKTVPELYTIEVEDVHLLNPSTW